jgi:Zn-dependent protease
MLNLILFLPIFLILLQAVALYIQAQRLLQVRFRYPRYEVQPVRELPSDHKQAFTPTIERLKDLGFELAGAYRVQKMFHFEHADDRAALLYHPAHESFAEVEIRWPADGQDLTNVNFYQAFSDQTWLLTLNGQAHGMIGTLPETIVTDPYCASLEAQWAHHQTVRQTIDCSNRSFTPGKFIAALQIQQQRYVDQLLAAKSLRIQREGWFLSGKAAFRAAWKMRQGVSAASKRQSARQRLIHQQPELVQSVPLNLQIQTFQRQRELETNHRDLRLGKWVLLGSLALFILVAIALPNSFGTFHTRDLITLLAVLFLHEAGHFLAMRLFGYQDTKMFFLPLFGAAVTGRKVDASLSEKVWVLLAGPLPGLILGCGLMAAVQIHPAWQGLTQPAWMLITLNMLNLLPIYPLDGGKIAHHLLFSRYPWADVVFKIFTVLLFGISGCFIPSLMVLAIATALSIPTSYRTARLNLTLQQQLAGDRATGRDLLKLVFQQMAAAGYGQLSLAKRDAIAKALVEQQRESRAPAWSRWSLAGIYGFSLIAGLGSTVIAAPQAHNAFSPRPTASATQRPRSAQDYVRRAQLAEQRFATEAAQLATPVSQRLVTATSVRPNHPSYGQLTRALADYDQAIKLDPDRPEFYQARAQLKLLMGRPEAVLTDYQALIEQDPNNPLLYTDRAELYKTLGQPRAAAADQQQAQRLSRAAAEPHAGV